MLVHHNQSEASQAVTWASLTVYALYVAVLLMWRAPEVIRDSLTPVPPPPLPASTSEGDSTATQ